MAECVYCQSETELYDSNVPICPKCSEAQDAKRRLVREGWLYQEVIAATERMDAATKEFHATLGNIPSGLPHPDGIQHIEVELKAAGKDVVKTRSRLDDFLSPGIVPEDLKGSGRAK